MGQKYLGVIVLSIVSNKGALVALYGYTVLRGIGRSGFLILFPLYILSIGYQTSDLGTIAMLASGLMILVLPFFGYLVDGGYSVEVTFISGLFMGLALILPILWNTYLILVFSYMLSSLSLMTWSPTRNRIIGHTVSARYMGRIYSLFILLFNTTRSATSFIIGRTTFIGYDKLMMTVGVVSLIGSVIVYIALRLTYSEEKSTATWSSLLEGYSSMFKMPGSIKPLIVFSLIDSFAWRLWFPLLNSYLKQYRGLTDPEIGDYNTLMSAAMMITAYGAGHITDWIKPIWSLILYEYTGALGLIILQFGNPLLMASSIFIGFSIAFWVSAYNTLITLLLGPSMVGRLRAVTDSARSLAGIPSPYIGGVLMTINPLYTFTLSIALMLISVAAIKRIGGPKGMVVRVDAEVPADNRE